MSSAILPHGSVAEDTVVDGSFDENVLRALCDLDVSLVTRLTPTRILPCIDATVVRRTITLGQNKAKCRVVQGVFLQGMVVE